MNILHLRSEYLDNGPGTQPLKIAKEFLKRGHHSYFAGAKGIMEKYIIKDGFTFFEVPELSIKKRDIISVLIATKKIRKILKQENIDVVHSHNAACSFIAFLRVVL
ncbi:glycosyltransferase [Psychrosphaera algicola]|uniref:Glycosyltransferase n=1 Tax=Psychrosphaera algicola TaxID=3023714 RepID=A0ABT5FJH5_9GAMM|nr:glycosyltransferase [Psychrosphaera sp. G1-22]MDC2891347.1 glycosyltransferase [Psychrosphaera sp. G1-22]